MRAAKETKKWWEYASKGYQKDCKIPVDIHYGPGSPNEKKLKLLGNIKGKKILEIGCGGAQCGIAMAKQGARVTGIDISEEQLKFAKKLAERNEFKIKFIQRDITTLTPINSKSQDIVFSAFALLYIENLKKCFKEVYRVLKKNGIFVFSLDHPFFNRINRKTLKIKRSYFDNSKWIEKNHDVDFVMFTRTISEIFNYLVEAGFIVEKILEPDSRKRYREDPWYGLWGLYTPKFLKMIPPTIIFKARKR